MEMQQNKQSSSRKRSAPASPTPPTFFDQVLKIASASKPQKPRKTKVSKKGEQVYLFKNKLHAHPRPDLSYNELIIEAIKKSENQMASLQEIYDYIQDTYEFFKESTVAWQNSIRHNLSVQKMFVRVPRPPNNPGKGGLWKLSDWAIENAAVQKKRKPEDSTAVNSPSVNNANVDKIDKGKYENLDSQLLDSIIGYSNPDYGYKEMAPVKLDHAPFAPAAEYHYMQQFQQTQSSTGLMDTLATIALNNNGHDFNHWQYQEMYHQPAGFSYEQTQERKVDNSNFGVMLNPLVGDKTLLQATFSDKFLKFVDASPSPFHAVKECSTRLLANGFSEIRESDVWSLKPNGKYFYTRNKSAIVAFAVGGKYKPGNGFSIVGAHTDSPCFKIKPVSKIVESGYLQVGVELYGGGIWHTWFDRDLSIAGKVIVEKNNKFEQVLVKIDESLLRIPTLAIHLDRTANESFTFNNEEQLVPILGQVKKAIENDKPHHAELLNLISMKIGVSADQIKDFELCLYDTQPAAIGGLNGEFIHSARLDNLMMSFCGINGLINAGDLENDENIRVCALFDNEEVGSVTAHGADSNLMEVTLQRLAKIGNPTEEGVFERAMTKSLLVSADMAHGLHPNYKNKHEKNHQPTLNGGVVIKHNANQKYATTSITCLILKESAKVANVNLQEFVVRNDSPCGSTIGPMLSAKLGLQTIDVGNPQWSMHSVRETAGTKDVGDAVLLFKAFYENFASIQRKLSDQ
ncbi:hypothetical protein HK103_002282 [Boothiomyces macroporosus]|uniref:aspartyl aminopeptidase n=1 Tax=Boothiomyces macroporosus TaxID=261099 RepID=A0AAD5UIS9_9FUNG|nr:hypothetical protein HK103_002282 [Boothiomyces macroporosus]